MTATVDATTLDATKPAYYGQPILKPPTWTNLIPTYFFTGGLAGVSSMLSFAARLHGDKVLERTMDVTTIAAIGASTFCLIKDLGRPERFMHMLRVIKPISPMNVGTFVFSFFSGATTLGFALDAAGVTPFATPLKAVAAAIGPVMSTYTGVLISDTAVPAWHEGRGSLPALFAAGAAMSAAGAGLLFASRDSGMCRTLALAAVCADLTMLNRLHEELGEPLARAYETGPAKSLSHWSRRLTIAGGFAALASWKLPFLRRPAGAMLLASALLERFAVVEAGRISAKDPSYVIAQQADSKLP